MLTDGPYSNADINTIKAFMVDFSADVPKLCIMEQKSDSSLFDCLLSSEYDKLQQDGFASFSTETGYQGVMYYPDKEDYARAMILDKIKSHAEGLKITYDVKVGELRKIYKWLNV